MGRKAKNRLVPKIEKIFQDSEEEILPFDRILTKMGERKSVIAGILSSYPERFDPAGVERSKDGTGEYKRTLWRLVPDEQLSLRELQEVYNVDPETMLELMQEENRSLRYACWSAEPDENGNYNRRDIHYVLLQYNKAAAKRKVREITLPLV